MTAASVAADATDRIEILGVKVSAISLDDATATLERWIHERGRHYVCITGVHGIMESRRDARLREIHNDAEMVTPDGMPLVWLARALGKSRTRRVYGPDLMRKMTAIAAEKGYRQFYYGGAEGVAERLRQKLVAAHPGLKVVGTLCPPYRELLPEEDRAVVEIINAAKPDIVWIGLSTPKQEYWMARHVGLLETPVIIGVGAAFDFVSGVKRQAPLWMQRSGLEWLFRLCSEPRRLWRRYATIVPGFAVLAVRNLARASLRSRRDVRAISRT